MHAFYGETHAVRGVSLNFQANRVTAMIGPSGCGSSTLGRCINRMHEEIPGARATTGRSRSTTSTSTTTRSTWCPCAARSAWCSRSRTRSRRCRSSTTSPRGLRLTGRRGEIRERVEKSLRGAGLWDEVKDRLGAPGIGLSGGQQQRLCIARTIAVEPEVILMDEPCSALDPLATLRIEELIEDLKRRYTIVIVTHNMQQAARVADETAFMLNGELVEFGPTERIFTSPQDSRTEEYVTGKFG